MLTALAPASQAQNPPANPAMQKAQAEVQAFEKSLNITADQKKKLTAIQVKYSPKLKAVRDQLMKEGGPNPAPAVQQALGKKWADQTKPLFAAVRKEQNAVYTPQQLTRIKAFQAKMQKQYGGTPGK